MRSLSALALFAVIALNLGCSSKGNSSPTATTAPSTSTQTSAATAALPTATATLLASSAASPTPLPSPAVIVQQGDGSRRSVALTFDAGSDAGHTAEILATLRGEGIRASFGVTGRWAEANPDLMRAIAADGHQFINHTYDHLSFTGFSTGDRPLTFAQRALELTRTETTIYRSTNRSTLPYFRPPYGDLDPSVPVDVAAFGYSVIVMWSIDTLGWNHATADDIVQRTLSRATPGAIIIMHVGSESEDGAALPRVIAGLRDQGYGFETVDELLQ